jgi:hypothetical protein
MILPLYASIERIDFSLVEAARDLYASSWQAFRKVTWPLTRPGVIAGSILVFIPSLGSYVTPQVLGGGRNMMLANLISGLQSSANPANPIWGETFPTASIGGGFQVIEIVDTVDQTYGIFVRLQNPATGALPANSPGVHAISPIRAFAIDRKIDDGLANSGSVAGEFDTSNCENGATGVYLAENSLNCTMLFKIDN